MYIAIFVNTPAQVHFYKNIAKSFEKKGDRIIFLARDYRETVSLLNEMSIRYFKYSKSSKSKNGNFIQIPLNFFKAFEYLTRIKPDMFLGFGGYESYTAFLLKKPSIVFNDSEPHIKCSYSIYFKLSMPFANTIITPDTFTDYLGDKHINVKSYKELAYLHPNYFKPDKNIFELLEIDKNEEYIILRFNAFDAVHDIGMGGFSIKEKRKLVDELEKYVKVFISAEQRIPKDLENRLLKIPKNKIHDCLYYAKMLITDTQTMTTEAGILGTPAIRSNTFIGKRDMGNFGELEEKYHLIFNFRNSNQAIEKALQLVQDPNLKKDWMTRKQKFLNDKIDLTAFMVWYVENYPESYKEMKENPDIQFKFR
jgi:predicted glycosyltransferase